MYELSNEQRKCFGLAMTNEQWERIEAKPSPYDDSKTYLYIYDNTIVKCILASESRYCEYELCEKISADRKYLLPKTEKGKQAILSSSTVLKRKGIGMSLCYSRKFVGLYD